MNSLPPSYSWKFLLAGTNFSGDNFSGMHCCALRTNMVGQPEAQGDAFPWDGGKMTTSRGV